MWYRLSCDRVNAHCRNLKARLGRARGTGARTSTTWRPGVVANLSNKTVLSGRDEIQVLEHPFEARIQESRQSESNTERNHLNDYWWNNCLTGPYLSPISVAFCSGRQSPVRDLRNRVSQLRGSNPETR